MASVMTWPLAGPLVRYNTGTVSIIPTTARFSRNVPELVLARALQPSATATKPRPDAPSRTYL
ncbi:hypothetical protein HMPREF9153_0421 [Cutibacterium avidum ATCC 25577]|uniref:Uncharacterized protein n=1 Tax=Cutibacterium avidum ATCC 25577 TaxID=997355 RepID=G4CV64_9ACTN|nr:hypothetical protein HMPREF9153_0421 [Cutibacterium avidum ATCC 25577]